MTRSFAAAPRDLLRVLLCGLFLAAAAPLVAAQQPATPQRDAAPADAAAIVPLATPGDATADAIASEADTWHPLQVGDATQSLLARQRNGTQASSTPRPIAGDIAGRSYQRYLKSFEREIPENFNSMVETTKGGAGK